MLELIIFVEESNMRRHGGDKKVLEVMCLFASCENRQRIYGSRIVQLSASSSLGSVCLCPV